MPQDYKQFTLQLRNRLDPENIIFDRAIKEELSSISYADVLEYVRYAMNGVEATYTQRSKDAGERVKSHLTTGGVLSANFEYQGSVMTNTHIKGFSDIDLLVISSKFYHYDFARVNEIVNDYSKQQIYNQTQLNKINYENQLASYAGNSMDDLHSLRLDSERIMLQTYSICDISKPKSIKINNTSLNRDVDIVIANWYDDLDSIISGKGNKRGIQVYNKDLRLPGKVDFPFFSIERINSRSTETAGRLKKMIRFLKNVKAKSELDIKLSSFDFNAICYDIPTYKYISLPFYSLVSILFVHLHDLATNQISADNLVSVDGREYIFRGNPEKAQSVRNLMNEVYAIYNDLKSSSIL